MEASTTGTPPPSRPDGGHDVASPQAWNQPTQPLRQLPQHSRDWWPFIAFGGITLLIGCVAVAVVLLSR